MVNLNRGFRHYSIGLERVVELIKEEKVRTVVK